MVGGGRDKEEGGRGESDGGPGQENGREPKLAGDRTAERAPEWRTEDSVRSGIKKNVRLRQAMRELPGPLPKKPLTIPAQHYPSRIPPAMNGLNTRPSGL